jgi:hypothetical protein
MRWWIFALLGGSLLVFVLWSRQQASDAEMEASKVASGPGTGLQPSDASSAVGDAVSGSHSRSIPETDPSPEADASHQTESIPEVVLAEAKQKRIWDSEHATFELETYFGKAFQKAVRDRDAEAIEAFFIDPASVSLIPDSGGLTDSAATVSETRADASTLEPVDVAGLASQLIQSVAPMKEIQGSKLRVLHLETDDELNWTSRILLEFSGLTSDQQPYLLESQHTLGLTFSSDDDIQAGRIVTAWRDDSRSLRRSDGVLMKEVTKSAGLANLPLPDNWEMSAPQRSQYWFQVAVADFNKDNYPDIAAATISGKPLLLQSEAGKRFVDITDKMRLRSWEREHMESLATWIDFNNDSWPDLLLGNRLYRNVSGKAFLDVTAKSGLRFGHEPMGATVADYDCDGLADLYILYQHDAVQPTTRMPWVGDSKTGVRNQLWHNEGGGRFRDVTEESNAGGGMRHSFAAVWHFVDDDQYPDLYIANDFGQNVHLRNRGDGTFEDISSEAATADFATSMGVSTGDLNNDGRPELYVANMYSKMGRRIIGNVCNEDYPAGIYDQIQGSCTGNRLYTLQGDSKAFQEISELAGVNEVGWAYAPSMADFDSDGLLDIYATTGFMSAQRGKPDG